MMRLDLKWKRLSLLRFAMQISIFRPDYNALPHTSCSKKWKEELISELYVYVSFMTPIIWLDILESAIFIAQTFVFMHWMSRRSTKRNEKCSIGHIDVKLSAVRYCIYVCFVFLFEIMLYFSWLISFLLFCPHARTIEPIPFSLY